MPKLPQMNNPRMTRRSMSESCIAVAWIAQMESRRAASLVRSFSATSSFSSLSVVRLQMPAHGLGDGGDVVH